MICLSLEETETRLAEAAQRCTTELIMMQSCVAQEPPAARYARPLVLDTARRGVAVRLLYPHTGRGDTVTRSYLHEVIALDGQVRTCDDIFDRFVVFDRATVFILTSFALILTGPTLATSLAQSWGLGPVFEWAWKILQWPVIFALVSVTIAVVYRF